ncbi:hypothetical protein C2E16_13500 [Mixta calida]|uniref:Uncharacterized protein n=1 Tax=Mixta calida TaxID=665913 RepID=A0ABM6S2I8_9GAMM|nr:hypothetical protein C2E16_13500 [Mixta calida]
MLVVATRTRTRFIKSLCGTLFFIIMFSIFKYFKTEDFFSLKNIFQIGMTGVLMSAIFYRFLFK